MEDSIKYSADFDLGGLFALDYSEENVKDITGDQEEEKATSFCTQTATSDKQSNVTREEQGEAASFPNETETRKGNKWLSYKDMCILIASRASDWKKAKELAHEIEKNEYHIRIRIIPRMLNDGYLERMHKDSPRSPVQKYRTTRKGKRLIGMNLTHNGGKTN